MIKKVFTIFDEKSEAYLQPFFLDTTGQAIRAITDCINDPNHQFSRHTSDYTLFQIAEYDDSKGIFTESRHLIGSLLEFKPKANITDLKSVGGTQ